MKLRLQRVSRLPDVPLWICGVVAFWGGLVLAAQRLGLSGPTCLLKRSLGVSCPTCGSTRAVLQLGEGHWKEALTLNPLVTSALFLGLLALLFRMTTGLWIQVEPGRRGWLWPTLAFLLLLAINWAWVLTRG